MIKGKTETPAVLLKCSTGVQGLVEITEGGLPMDGRHLAAAAPVL